MEWYLKVVQNYFGFSGRAHRTEFWMFVLINLVILIALNLVDGMLGTVDATTNSGYISSLYSLGVLIPGIAVSIRRLHDTGRSAWWLLLGLIPLIGTLALIVFYCLDSEGDNEYGSNPKVTA